MQNSDTGKREIAAHWATRKDIEAYFGKTERRTLRAMIITLDGEPAGIAGLAREQGWLTLFSQYKEELEPHLGDIRVIRPSYEIFKLVKKAKMPVIAEAQHGKGHQLLQKLGFERVNEDWYAWRG